MSLMLNPVEQAIVESSELYLTREELALELAPLADADTIEHSIEFLLERRLIEGLEIATIARGNKVYRTTPLGRRVLRIHRRALGVVPGPQRRRGLHLV
jgi:hypothetical protein